MVLDTVARWQMRVRALEVRAVRGRVGDLRVPGFGKIVQGD
jgi:hypothetical protein